MTYEVGNPRSGYEAFVFILIIYSNISPVNMLINISSINLDAGSKHPQINDRSYLFLTEAETTLKL